ncbi:hypothetical protein TIFTF001_028440 [Ficus carica]|uniref:DUF1985 domain-containing protein n=1 Tax=Ficus carica TaxID=3494 RepID=A0AA88J1H4_FICCA|nr:hypothetical protein TIFTF001_028440 [Ficus carica]
MAIPSQVSEFNRNLWILAPSKSHSETSECQPVTVLPHFQLSSYSLQPTLEAQDVGVGCSIVAAFDYAVGFVIAGNHVVAIVFTSGETNEMNINSSNEEVDEEEPDMSRMVLTSEIKELPPLILAEYFSAKVTIRSKMAILEEIQIWLTEEEKTVFRSYPQLGHFIDLPIGGAFSGLYTGGGPSEDEIKAQEQNDELKNKYWRTKKGVSLADVAQKLKELSVIKVRTDDRVKLAFLYMVAGFLMSSDSKKVVNPSWLQYANDLNFFTQYPWGNVCYNQTLDYIKTDLVAKFNKSSTTYNFYGCPWIFQIWAFEAMPKLGEMLANKLALNEKNKNGPRCLRWQIVKNPIGTSFERCLEAMRYPEFTVRPTLNSTSKERQRDYYLRMERREDCSDDVIDGLTKSFPVSSAHEQMIRSSTPVVYHRQHPMPTSPTFLDPATASTSFPTIPTMFEPIRASPPQGRANTWPDTYILNPFWPPDGRRDAHNLNSYFRVIDALY